MNKNKTLAEVCELLNLLSIEHETEIDNGDQVNALHLRKAFNSVLVKSCYPLSQIYYTMYNSEDTTAHTKELFDVFVGEKNAQSVAAFKTMHSNFEK